MPPERRDHRPSSLFDVLDNVGDASLVTTLAGVILFANTAARALFGYAEATLPGQSVDVLLPDALRAGHAQLRNGFLATRQQRGKASGRMFAGRRQDGSEVQLDIALSTLQVDGATVIVATLRDMTAVVRRNREMAEEVARLRLLDRVSQLALEKLDFAECMEAVVDELEIGLAVDLVSVLAIAPATSAMGIVARSKSARQRVDADPRAMATLKVGDADLSAMLGDSETFIADSADASPLVRERLAVFGLRSMCAFPWQIGTLTSGALVVCRASANGFSDTDREFFRTLAQHIRLAWTHHRALEDLRRANADLCASQAAAVQQERLRALGEMAAGIVHDINNAVSPVIGTADILLDSEPDLSPSAREGLEMIRMAGRDMAQIATRLRAFHRGRDDAAVMTRIDAAAMLRQVVQLTRGRWRDRAQQRGVTVRVELDIHTDLLNFPGIEAEVREALVNLVVNAVDAMPAGGVLTLRACHCDPSHGRTPAPICMPRPGATDFALFEVTDTGEGMDEATRQRCLEPFFTTKGEQGTGLGLAMVFGVMRRHEGMLDIASEPGRGTTVRIAFPAGPLPVSRPRMATDEVAVAAARSLRVLHVDDDALLRRAMAHLLTGLGHQSVAAANGVDALALFGTALTSDRPFDIVITDLDMPELDGRALASRIHALAPAMPVLLLTGGAMGMAELGPTASFRAVLTKPLTVKALRRALAEALA